MKDVFLAIIVLWTISWYFYPEVFGEKYAQMIKAYEQEMRKR